MSLPRLKSISGQKRLLNDSESDKLCKIILNFYIKSANLITSLRDPNIVSTDGINTTLTNTKVNKWFNLLTTNNSSINDDISIWRKASDPNDVLNLPPLIIETYLDLRRLSSDQTLVIYDDEKNNDFDSDSGDDSDIYHDEYSNPIVVPKANKKSEIVLERWLIEFSINEYDNESKEIPTIYKQLVILFRALTFLIQLLPTYKLLKFIKNDETRLHNLSIGTRILDGSKAIYSKGRIGLSKNIGSSSKKDTSPKTNDHIVEKFLKSVLTPVGALKISVNYRKNCRFDISYNDVILSSHYNTTQAANISSSYSKKKQDLDQEDEPELHIQQEHQQLQQQQHLKRLSLSSSSKSPTDSIRSVHTNPIQLFKVGSINSSNSPPPNAQPLSQSQIMLSSTNQSINLSSNTSSQPIPMLAKNNRSNSSASLVAILRHNRGSINSVNTDRLITNSVSPTDTFYHAGTITNNLNVSSSHNTNNINNSNSPITSGSGSIGSNATHPTKFSSSFGSRFRNSYGGGGGGGVGSYNSINNNLAISSSRNNSIDGAMAGNIDVNLLSNRNIRSSSIDSNVIDESPNSYDPTSMYLHHSTNRFANLNFPIEHDDIADDDGIDQFVKMIESKPGLRFASSTTQHSSNDQVNDVPEDKDLQHSSHNNNNTALHTDQISSNDDLLSRFQMLKDSHDILSDNIIMQSSQNMGIAGAIPSHNNRVSSLHSQSPIPGFHSNSYKDDQLGSSPSSYSMLRNQRLSSISQSKALQGNQQNPRRSSSVSSNSSNSSSILNLSSSTRRRSIGNIPPPLHSSSKSSSGTPIDIYSDPQLILRRNSDIRRRRSSATSSHNVMNMGSNSTYPNLSNSPNSQIMLKNLSSSTTSTTNVTPTYARLYSGTSGVNSSRDALNQGTLKSAPLPSSSLQHQQQPEKDLEKSSSSNIKYVSANDSNNSHHTNSLRAMLLSHGSIAKNDYKSFTTTSSRKNSNSKSSANQISTSVPINNEFNRKIDPELLELRTKFSNMNKLRKDQEEVILDDEEDDEEEEEEEESEADKMSDRSISPNTEPVRKLSGESLMKFNQDESHMSILRKTLMGNRSLTQQHNHSSSTVASTGSPLDKDSNVPSSSSAMTLHNRRNSILLSKKLYLNHKSASQTSLNDSNHNQLYSLRLPASSGSINNKSEAQLRQQHHNHHHHHTNHHHQQQNSQVEDDEDELLFAMSDMTSVKNAHEY